MAESNVVPPNSSEQHEDFENLDTPTTEDIANDRSRKAVNASLFCFIHHRLSIERKAEA